MRKIKEKKKRKNLPITKLLSCHNHANTPLTIIPYKAPQFKNIGTPFKANSLRG
jgi:hypothetical protein